MGVRVNIATVSTVLPVACQQLFLGAQMQESSLPSGLIRIARQSSWGDNLTGKSLGERVVERREELKMSQTQLAKKVGISQQSLSAIEKGETKRPRNISDLARALSTTVSYLETGQRAPGANYVGVNQSDGLISPSASSQVEIVGRCGAGNWREDWLGGGVRKVAPFPYDDRFPPNAQFAMEVDGDDFDEFYERGTVINLVSIEQTGIVPRHEDHVLVTRRNSDGLEENTVREVAEIEGGIQLVSRSKSGSEAPPIDLTNQNGGVEVQIRARVIGHYHYK